MCSGKKLYLGDFNVWIDGMKGHVNKATHDLGHTLDIVIDCVDSSIVGCANVEPQNTIYDHMVVNLKTFVDDIPKIKAVTNFRNYKTLEVVDFSNYLLTNFVQFLFSNWTHLTNMSPMCVNCETNFHRNDASSCINQKPPLICKEITVRETSGVWYNGEIHETKKKLRKKRKNFILSMKMTIIKPNFV